MVYTIQCIPKEVSISVDKVVEVLDQDLLGHFRITNTEDGRAE